MSKSTMQTEKVINHILEIIYLMTGEEYMIVKKPVPYKCIPQMSEDLCQTRNSIVEIPTNSQVHLRGDGGPSIQPNHGLIRDVENKLLDTVFQPPAGSGHVQIKCDDIAIYLSVEEWEYLEKHKEQYDGTIKDNQTFHENIQHNAHLLDRTYTPLSLQDDAQTQPGSQCGAQTQLDSQCGAQTQICSQCGAQTQLNSQCVAQPQLSSQCGGQTSLFSQVEAQTSLFSQVEAQTSLFSQNGAQASHFSQDGAQPSLFSQNGAQPSLFSQNGAQPSLFSQNGAQTSHFSQDGAQTSHFSQDGAQTSFFSQDGAQTSHFSQDGAQTSFFSKDDLNQGHKEGCNVDQEHPHKKVRRPGKVNRHLGSIGKGSITKLMLCGLSKCEVDENKYSLNKFTTNSCPSSPSPEPPQLNASPDAPIYVKEEDTLAADGSCMENVTDGYHSQFPQFDLEHGQNNINKYPGGHTVLENMEKNKDMAWNATSASTENVYSPNACLKYRAEQNALESNRGYSAIVEGHRNMKIEPNDSMLNLNKVETFNYDPFPGMLLEAHIKKELTSRECSASEESHQTMTVEVNDAIRSLNKDPSVRVLESNHTLTCSPNPFPDIRQLTQLEDESSSPLDYQNFVKKMVRPGPHGTLQSAGRSQTCVKSLKAVSCSDCGKLFSCNAYLMRHKRVHTGEKPYTCSECGRSFSWVSSLITHKRTHSGEKPFPCTQCGKRFADYSGIIKHQRIHTGEKPYSCVMCGERFAQTYQLVKHQSLHSIAILQERL